jgi:hypothetical protein
MIVSEGIETFSKSIIFKENENLLKKLALSKKIKENKKKVSQSQLSLNSKGQKIKSPSVLNNEVTFEKLI